MYDIAEQLKVAGDYRQAIEKYVAAEYLQPEYKVQTKIKKAFCYYQFGEHDQVMRCLDELGDEKEINHLAINLEAMSKYALGQIEDSFNLYMKLLEIPDHVAQFKGAIGSGMCLCELKRLDEGEEYFEKALKMSKTNPEKKTALHNIGWVNFLRENYALALQQYFEALQYDNSDIARNIVSYHAIAEVYIQQKDYDNALSYLAKAQEENLLLQSREFESEYYFLNGKLYQACGDYKNALEYYIKSRALLDPRNKGKLYAIGEQLSDIYILHSDKEKELMSAEVAFELYSIYKELNPQKAAGFLAIYREIEKKHK